jgi:transposase
MRIPTLLPDPQLVVVEHLAGDAASITLVVRTIRPAVPCPDCGHLAGRVHSRYPRTAADLPWNGVRVRLRVRSRKFFCGHPDCGRVIFCERLPGLLERYARRTQQLAQTLHWIGYLLGGEGGARLTVTLGLGVSPSTLLRLLRARAPRKVATARVLGVDDWAFRRRRRYGSILVDLEAGQTLDLLPDRKGETLAAWLKGHPGVQFVCRDRAAVYAEGAYLGAPQAEQVVDRWHLLNNLSDALEEVVGRHRPALREAARRLAPATSPPSEDSGRPPPAKESRLARKQGPMPLRRDVRRERVRQLASLGFTQKAIAAQLRVSQDTVHRDLHSPQSPQRSGGRRPALGPYAKYLQERWRSGCRNASQLHRELMAQGFTGSHDALLRFVKPWRGPLPAPERRAQVGIKARAAKRRAAKQRRGFLRGSVPTPRQVTWWLLTDARKHSGEQRAFLKHLVAECPAVAAAQRLTREFFRIVRKRDLPALTRWFDQAANSDISELEACARSLRADQGAVAAALSYPFSNGPVEGHVNRLKLVKRQMYGRAGFDLLRARVLPIAL